MQYFAKLASKNRFSVTLEPKKKKVRHFRKIQYTLIDPIVASDLLPFCWQRFRTFITLFFETYKIELDKDGRGYSQYVIGSKSMQTLRRNKTKCSLYIGSLRTTVLRKMKSCVLSLIETARYFEIIYVMMQRDIESLYPVYWQDS